MGRLIIVGGASGAGKTHLLHHTVDRDKTIHIVPKLTTRGPRDHEYKTPPRDLILNCTPAEVAACDYSYPYEKDQYGIRENDIEEVRAQERHPMLIVRDGRTIERLKNRYADAFALWVQTALSGKDLEKRLRELGLRDLKKEDRAHRTALDFDQYVRYIDLFDGVLINYYDNTIYEQLNKLLYSRRRNT